ncbi:sigma-70 family RNA polymerase sigma factor [Alterinioella nitratireducens]|uniref:sigma-70 family RNA polymerase sigma factor n=1 Tax=Alterinioella nitratireducens TaxID=2735915 RepID=UPI00405958EB
MTDASAIEGLIARTALKDRAAFQALYAATSAKLFGICLRVLKDRAEAEDTLQEVFVKIWHRADRYRVTGHSPMTWLITVARNSAIDRLRKRPRESGGVDVEDLALSDPAPGPEAQAVASGEAARIAGCLDELEQDRAAAVRGAYLEGETYADLARRFDVPINTMRTWLRRSLMKLKECLTA